MVSKDKVSQYDRWKITIGSFTKQEVKKILSKLKYHNMRLREERVWRMFFSLIAYAGLFPGEVSALTKKDLDFKNAIITANSSKILKKRVVPIPRFLMYELKKLFKDLRDNSLLFVERRSKRAINTGAWDTNFSSRLRKTGFSKEEIKKRNLSTLSLRNFYIEECLRNGVPLTVLKKVLGHSDVRQTSIYAKKLRTRITSDHVRELGKIFKP